MAIDIEKLAQISNLDELRAFSTELSRSNHEYNNEYVKDLQILACYEAFLQGANAVYEEYGNGDEFDVSALKFLKNIQRGSIC